jgi:methylated-DNA-[protein]-cysteine S-methyltransferase
VPSRRRHARPPAAGPVAVTRGFVAPAAGATPRWERFASPVGEILLVSDGEALTGVFLGDDHGAPPRAGAPWRHDPGALAPATRQLRAYFAGELRRFDLALAPAGSPFQLAVWSALLTVPYARTVSYGDIAALVGAPRASRAVGRANNRNPLVIVVPCHRVIGADGDLTGYGGGLPRKRALLDLELRHRDGGAEALELPVGRP